MAKAGGARLRGREREAEEAGMKGRPSSCPAPAQSMVGSMLHKKLWISPGQPAVGLALLESPTALKSSINGKGGPKRSDSAAGK